MATDYRVILLDEFDWEYMNHNKDMARTVLKDAKFEETASAYGMLVLECRFHPQSVLTKLNNPRNVLWDRAYIQETPNGGLREMDL